MGKNKKTYTVKRFKHEWLNEVIDGVTVKTWLVADPTDSSRGKCLVWPARIGSLNTSGRSFRIAEGRRLSGSIGRVTYTLNLKRSQNILKTKWVLK